MNKEKKKIFIEGIYIIGSNLVFLVLSLIFRFVFIPAIFDIISEGIK